MHIFKVCILAVYFLAVYLCSLSTSLGCLQIHNGLSDPPLHNSTAILSRGSLLRDVSGPVAGKPCTDRRCAVRLQPGVPVQPAAEESILDTDRLLVPVEERW